jgi:hypothetical protein
MDSFFLEASAIFYVDRRDNFSVWCLLGLLPGHTLWVHLLTARPKARQGHLLVFL